MTEVGFGNNNNVAETSYGMDGTVITRPLAFFDGATNADRVKTLAGTARVWFLRGPDPSDARDVRGVSTDGSLYGYLAYYARGLVAAWVIGNPVIASA